MLSIAHPELGPRDYEVIFQYSKKLHFPKTSTYVESLKICMYLRGMGYLVDPKPSRRPFLFQKANTILLPHFIHCPSIRADNRHESNLWR